MPLPSVVHMLSVAADKRAAPERATSGILAGTAGFPLSPRERVRVSGNQAIATLLTLKCTLLVAASVLARAEPPEKQDKPKIDVCFVLDTTGSMSGLIEGAKQKIWSIANEITSARPTPDIRIGLVGYRDRGERWTELNRKHAVFARQPLRSASTLIPSNQAV